MTSQSTLERPVVLLVEDNELFVTVITKQLGEYCDIIHAESLAECHRSGEADVCILDLNLPNTLGVETVHQFVLGNTHIPVVVLTAVDDAETEAQCIAAGAHAYFNKGEYTVSGLVRAMLSAIKVKQRETHRAHEIAVHLSSISNIRSMTEKILERLDTLAEARQ